MFDCFHVGMVFKHRNIVFVWFEERVSSHAFHFVILVAMHSLVRLSRLKGLSQMRHKFTVNNDS